MLQGDESVAEYFLSLSRCDLDFERWGACIVVVVVVCRLPGRTRVPCVGLCLEWPRDVDHLVDKVGRCIVWIVSILEVCAEVRECR